LPATPQGQPPLTDDLLPEEEKTKTKTKTCKTYEPGFLHIDAAQINLGNGYALEA